MFMVMTSMAHAELVFYAPFDGDTTSVTDLSGQGNHGTLGTGTSITTIDVKLGSGAADLADGNAGILGSTDNGFAYGNDPWSISAWVKTTSARGVLLGWGNDAGRQNTNLWFNQAFWVSISHWAPPEATYPIIGTNGWTLPDGSTLNNGTWHLVTGTYDGTTERLYVDGVEIATVSGDTLELTAGETNKWIISSKPDAATGETIVGQIDDAAIWNHALSADDVAALWNNGDGLAVQSLLGPAANLSPPNAATDIPRDGVELSWKSGPFAVAHDVYFGSSFDDVNSATPASPTFQGTLTETGLALDRLEFVETYYWRVDEVNDLNPKSPWPGNVWSFTVEPYAIAVTDVSVTASDNTEDPNRTIDGSGLADGFHGTDVETMWKTAAEPEHPVWIQFAFDKPCKLSSMKVWNHNSNSEGLLGFGFKDVTIETSVDGTTWSALPDVQFAQAPGKSDYAGTLIDLGGTLARYVMLTGKNNWSTLGLQNLGLSEVRFMQIPTHVRELKPTSGSVISPVNAVLTWRPGRDAASHQVLLGTNPDALSVIDTVTENKLDISSHLSLEETYYWQVNEVNDAETPAVWAGPVLEFSTLDSLVIDDMESYKDKEGSWIWGTWADGYENPTENGSTVGHGDLPETIIVRSPGQSMPLFYDNTAAPTSKATRTFDQPDDITDWTQAGIQTLVLHIYGDPNNTGGQLYVEINGVKIPFTDDAGAITKAEWTQWNVDLSSVNTNLAKVNSLAIGVDGAGVAGVIYVDDIALYRLAPLVLDATLVAYWNMDEAARDNGTGRHGR